MRYLTILIFFLISLNANSGQFADFVGAYLANGKGECKSTVFFGKEYPDSNINGVCIPVTAMFDDEKKDIVSLAITELKNPNQLEDMIQLELAKQQPTEAFEVEIDKHNDDIFKLVDGSVLEKTGYGYVGYIGYHEDGILYKDGSQWKLCVNNSSYEVDALKYVKHHYSKNSIHGKSVKEIEAMDVCN
ncbi:hypothetical protein [uncultured Oceanisphaera sp.]|uniref:hypothetical protein n=1 Tax=uncultured Oceanisphaera sp. TaxID=353858 RepID=UPI002612F9BE|nr:hypothetical protein [uncultured Oceanisphaera sp.]